MDQQKHGIIDLQRQLINNHTKKAQWSSIEAEKPEKMVVRNEKSRQQKKEMNDQYRLKFLMALLSKDLNELKNLKDKNPDFPFHSIHLNKIGIPLLALETESKDICHWISSLPHMSLDFNVHEREYWEGLIKRQTIQTLWAEIIEGALGQKWFDQLKKTHSNLWDEKLCPFDIQSPSQAWLLLCFLSNSKHPSSFKIKNALHNVPLSFWIQAQDQLKLRSPQDTHPLHQSNFINFEIQDEWDDFFKNSSVAQQTTNWILKQKNIFVREQCTRTLFERAIDLDSPDALHQVFRFLNEPLAEMMAVKKSLIPSRKVAPDHFSGIEVNHQRVSESIRKNNFSWDADPFDILFTMEDIWRIPCIPYALMKGHFKAAQYLSKFDFFNQEANFNARGPLGMDLLKSKALDDKGWDALDFTQPSWFFMFAKAHAWEAKALQILKDHYHWDPKVYFLDEHPLVSMALYQNISKTKLEDWYRKCPSLFERHPKKDSDPLNMASKQASSWMKPQDLKKLESIKTLIEKSIIKKTLVHQNKHSLQNPTSPKIKRL